MSGVPLTSFSWNNDPLGYDNNQTNTLLSTGKRTAMLPLYENTLTYRIKTTKDADFWKWLQETFDNINEIDLDKRMTDYDFDVDDSPLSIEFRLLSLSILRGDEVEEIQKLQEKINPMDLDTLAIVLIDSYKLINHPDNNIHINKEMSNSGLIWLSNIITPEILRNAVFLTTDTNYQEEVFQEMITLLKRGKAKIEEQQLETGTPTITSKNLRKTSRL